MPSYLLTWNPKKTSEHEVQRITERIEQAKGLFKAKWSCGNTKKIRPGDRIFLIRLGSEPKGIVGGGWATAEPKEGDSWTGEAGKKSQFVKVVWERIQTTPIITMAEFESHPFLDGKWDPQRSGITIKPAGNAHHLEVLWAERMGTGMAFNPDEVFFEEYREGAMRRTLINAYERNLRARKVCLDHHGYACAVCRVLLSAIYGPVADKFIHVHHVKPISEMAGGRAIKPVKDLRPVCPNCHAVLHRRYPPYSIAEVQEMLRANNRNSRSAN